MSEPTGVLATSEPGQTKTLSSGEYRLLLNALELWQREGDKEADAISRAIQNNHYYVAPGEIGTLGVFLKNILENLGDHVDEIKGLLVVAHEPAILFDEGNNGESRLECLTALVKLLERGDWFADYLKMMIPYWSAHKSPVTPHEVIRTLVEQAENFESDIENAKRMLALHPVLFESSRVAGEGTHQ